MTDLQIVADPSTDVEALILDWAGPAEALRIASQEVAALGPAGGGFALRADLLTVSVVLCLVELLHTLLIRVDRQLRRLGRLRLDRV